MWAIIIGIFAVFLIIFLIGGSGYCMAAPTASLKNIRAEFTPKVSKPIKKMSGSTLNRDKDVPKANF